MFEVSTELGNNWFPTYEGYRRLTWVRDPALCPAAPCTSPDQLIGFDMNERDKSLGLPRHVPERAVQRYNIGVRGGTDLIRYSFGINRSDQQGIVFWNKDKRNSVTTNLQVTASENLNIQLSGGYYQGGPCST